MALWSGKADTLWTEWTMNLDITDAAIWNYLNKCRYKIEILGKKIISTSEKFNSVQKTMRLRIIFHVGRYTIHQVITTK